MKRISLFSATLLIAALLSFACDGDSSEGGGCKGDNCGGGGCQGDNCGGGGCTGDNCGGGGGGEGTGVPWTKATPPSETDIAKVKSRKVFFAHKSVGDDLVNGIKKVSTIVMRKVYTNELSTVGSTTAFFEHDMVPPNNDPNGKLTAFKNAMDVIRNSGNSVDIAFMKFCYADFPANAKVNEVFNAYKTALQELKQSFPHVVFVHVTVPLERFNNRPREEFNKLLREAYGDKVFDLATLESTHNDGSIAKTTDGIITLAEEWTRDGGHLNDAGERRFGGALVSFLAQVPLKTTSPAP